MKREQDNRKRFKIQGKATLNLFKKNVAIVSVQESNLTDGNELTAAPQTCSDF